MMALRAIRNGRTEDQDDQAEDGSGVEAPRHFARFSPGNGASSLSLPQDCCQHFCGLVQLNQFCLSPSQYLEYYPSNAYSPI